MSNKNLPLSHRFGPGVEDLDIAEGAPAVHAQLAERASIREFEPQPVPLQKLRQLCALALCSPTKSDLQQRDIVIIDAPELRANVVSLLESGPLGQQWIAKAPTLMLFCGNNRRQRRLHELRGRPFANDHLDAFFNASVDAAIALSAFVIAAEAEGLGTCAISAVRNHAEAISRLVGLPDFVFPVAGLGIGYPTVRPAASMRLPLSVTVHRNAWSEQGLDNALEQYDSRRSAAQPYKTQRAVDLFGRTGAYGWSEDKARQFAQPERADFGDFVRRIGFKLD